MLASPKRLVAGLLGSLVVACIALAQVPGTFSPGPAAPLGSTSGGESGRSWRDPAPPA